MAVREPDRLFVNGVDLGKRWFLTVESTYQMPAQVRDGLVETPGRHGARGSGRPPLYDVGAGKLVLHVGGEGRGHLREVLDEVIGLLTGGSEVVLMHASGGQARQAVIEVQSWSVTERVPQVFADLEVSYVVPGVFLRSSSTTSRFLPPGSSVLTREGTAPITDAIVRFAGPSGGPFKVTEGVWGTGIKWTGMLRDYQYLFIDPRAMRAWTTSSSGWDRPASASDVSAGLSPATAGPLVLHHTTGWGAGAVTAKNESTNPRFASGAPNAYNDSTASLIDGQVVWQRNSDSGNPQPYLGFGPCYSFSVDFTNTSGQPLLLRAYTWLADSNYENYYYRAEPGETVRVGARVNEQSSGRGTSILLAYGTTAVPIPDPGAVLGTVDNLRMGDDAHTAKSGPAPYFDGDTPDTDDLIYKWTAWAGQSASTASHRVLTRSTPMTASQDATIQYREAWL